MTSTDGGAHVRVEFCDHGFHGGPECPLDTLPARYLYDPTDQTVLASPGISNGSLAVAVHSDLPVFDLAELDAAVVAARWTLLTSGELAGCDVTCELPTLTRERLAAADVQAAVRVEARPAVRPSARPRWRRVGLCSAVPLLAAGAASVGLLLPSYSAPAVLGPYARPAVTLAPGSGAGGATSRTERVAVEEPAVGRSATTRPHPPTAPATPTPSDTTPVPSVSPSPPPSTTTRARVAAPPPTSPPTTATPSPAATPTPEPSPTAATASPSPSPTCVPNPAGKGCDEG